MSSISLQYYYNLTDRAIHCIATTPAEPDKELCRCTVDYDKNGWAISAWYTNKDYLGQGIGSKVLKHTLRKLYKHTGRPEHIQYIWNGTNEYVGDWIKHHFDAVSLCPMAIQKTQSDDDWSSHVYELNPDKVFRYFSLDRIHQMIR